VNTTEAEAIPMRLITPSRLIPAALILATVLATGCSTLIQQSYEGDGTASNMHLSAYSGTTAVYGSTDPVGDARELVRQEYARLGVAHFKKDGRITYQELKTQAHDVGADIVLFSVTYPGSSQNLPPVALDDSGAPYTLSPFVYATSTPVAGATSAAVPPGAAAVNGQEYEYTLTFWRKAPVG
jgi:hypothetical protein